MTSRPSGFFQAMPMADVTRALPPALLWAYVSMIFTAILLAAVGVISAAVLGVMWLFDQGRAIADPAWTAVTRAALFAGPAALGAAVWGAAYASTTSRSIPRSMAGTAAAVIAGVGLLALDASSFAMAALALGWAIAIPAHNLGRVAWRGLVPLIVALMVLSLSWGRVGNLDLWQIMLAVVVSPPLAALWIWLADAVWMAARSSGKPSDRA